MIRYKEKDLVLTAEVPGGEKKTTPFFRTVDGKFHTCPAPESGASYWLDEYNNPLPARDKRDVVMVYEAWKADAAKTLNRLLGRQEKDDKRLKLWYARQNAYKK